MGFLVEGSGIVASSIRSILGSGFTKRHSGDADRYEQKRGIDDDFIQPENFYRLMLADEQKRLVANVVNSLKKVSKDIQKKIDSHFRKVDKDYGNGIAKGLGLS